MKSLKEYLLESKRVKEIEIPFSNDEIKADFKEFRKNSI